MVTFELDSFLSFTIGIVVFLTGVAINTRVSFLQRYSIPDAVTGGLLAASLGFVLYAWIGVELSYQLNVRDTLLIYFFTAIGLNARFRDLLSGGKPLLIMLGITLSYILLQNGVGVAGAWVLNLPTTLGVIAGSASLIGGHGTAIAWAPELQAAGIENALEIGVACATIGLVIASLIGGPIAQYLIKRHGLKRQEDEQSIESVASLQKESSEVIDHLSLMAVMLSLHLVIILGWGLNQALAQWGFKLPLFVCSLLVGIILSNFVERFLPTLPWPARSKALSVVSDFSLSLFLTMSLMSMQLWTIAGMASSLLVILLLQTLAAMAFIVWVLFPLMGRGYMAAVLSAGFGGFALGATPTAIANMTAVTKAHGAAPMAFIILPLVSAFFVDISNAFVIKYFLSL